ncbi:MAG: aminotransferase class I/II-fold pyridoxal phosphate-dependent enzyme, partial [Solirubrobacteraceae bacterium]|nr:aminotransferase class I/II-fold pyridoxal phosphate-dependent enzyme [Patulibacter sp.]
MTTDPSAEQTQAVTDPIEGAAPTSGAATGTPPRAAVDLFARIATNERLLQWKEGSKYDLSPYFRTAESAAAPIMRMEGKDRVMLGSNNYLGLTGDPRVLAAAHDAIDKYGSGLTGSRLLNGTIPLHVELETEIAEWMG